MSVCDIILIATSGAIGVPVVVLTAEIAAALLSQSGRSRFKAAAPNAPSHRGVEGNAQLVDRLLDRRHDYRAESTALSTEDCPLPSRQSVPGTADRPTAAVLIPAHNEASGIGRTIASIRPQLADGDRLLVVADNCTDETAHVARTLGADVVERYSSSERGKGFALAAGVQHLSAAPPDVVVVVDADMNLAPTSVDALVSMASGQQVPVQAVDLLYPPKNASPKHQISSFAFTLKNLVRAQGAEVLGIPCLLRGTGMAFPWHVVTEATLATGNIVEDMQLGMDLTLAGCAPRLCSDATVLGTLPEGVSAATTQRTRWEHGHLQTILHNVPHLLWQGIRQHRLGLIGLALDLAVPPLALLVVLWSGLTCLAILCSYFGWASRLPVVILLALGLLLALSILAAWVRFARSILPFTTLLAIPMYILWKIPLYAGFLVKRQKTWVRTARG